MKINLVINDPKKSLKEYANISPVISTNGFNKGSVDNLDWCADPASCTHIIADDILSRFTFSQIEKILHNWMNKLAIGGVLTIRGIDFEEVARALVLEQITIQESARLIYGDQKDNSDIRVSSLSILDLIVFLEQAGLKIKTKVFEGYEFTVSAIRKG